MESDQLGSASSCMLSPCMKAMAESHILLCIGLMSKKTEGHCNLAKLGNACAQNGIEDGISRSSCTAMLLKIGRHMYCKCIHVT